MPTIDEVNRLKSTLHKGLALKIPNFEILRRYEHHYDRLNPFISAEERFTIENQFARHENYLSEKNKLPIRPSKATIQKQKEIAYSQPTRAKSYDPPSASGVRTRKRSASEEALMSNEVINWDDFN